MFLPVAQQGQDRTSRAFSGEFPDPVDSLCEQRDGRETCRIPFCIPPPQRLVLARPRVTTLVWIACPAVRLVFWQRGKLRQR